MRVVSNLIEAHIFRIVNNKMEFLLLKRSEKDIFPNVWQMVTGTIKKSEKAFNTAIREIKEETCITPLKFWVVPNVNSFYNPNLDHVCMVPVFAAQVKNNCSVALSDEHTEFQWLQKEEAKKLLAWPGQRDSVDIIYNYFMNEKSFLKFVDISENLI
ncbi:MAG: NUDIX pyrophosphatase [Melioribacteraceae bacterium]|nr:NUDIX pyrophosphatase [Melioribacteraceae bacterium]